MQQNLQLVLVKTYLLPEVDTTETESPTNTSSALVNLFIARSRRN